MSLRKNKEDETPSMKVDLIDHIYKLKKQIAGKEGLYNIIDSSSAYLKVRRDSE